MSDEHLLGDSDINDQNRSSHRRPQEVFLEKNDDVLIEVLAEVYGLVTGPPAWRKSLFTTFKELEFKNHPLAPCLVLMYEKMHGKEEPQLSGLIIVETDDLLGGGREHSVAPKFHHAVELLRKRYQFGKWKILMDESTEYGGRALRQSKDFGVTISM